MIASRHSIHSFQSRKSRRAPLALLSLLSISFAPIAGATPPDYKSFHRDQSIEPGDLADVSGILEIWTIYVGQGDALLIRLPTSMNYTVDGRSERIDILVDGGPGLKARQFLNRLYPDGAIIEHVVLTHHDGDHIKGLTSLFADDAIGVENIYHNGLASWARGTKSLPAEGELPRTGLLFQAKRALALIDGADTHTLPGEFLVNDLNVLLDALSNHELNGVYADLADAINTDDEPTEVAEFRHVLRGGDFINQLDDRIGADISFDVLWPRAPQQRYRGWGETINGNSVTFKLDYRNFSMLFTGDHNEYSEEAWLETLDGHYDELASDVLKIPHHGSQHNTEAFFDAVDAVVGVASMGSMGFGPNWKHPSEEVIRWMGGSHRVYCTYIHERRFKYEDLETSIARNAYVESTHVLVQTDGNWFRVVEVVDPAPSAGIPSVQDTSRGDGTRWISAGE